MPYAMPVGMPGQEHGVTPWAMVPPGYMMQASPQWGAAHMAPQYGQVVGMHVPTAAQQAQQAQQMRVAAMPIPDTVRRGGGDDSRG